MKSAFALYFIIIEYSFNLSFGLHVDDDMDVSYLSAIEIIEKYGYPSEVHHVETEDGFILELHRIPFGKYSHKKNPGYPILMEPGLLASSTEFLLLGSHSLPFYLADAGYDVWLVNFRGNRFSSQHKYYTEDDKEYWDFSWHEMGVYDAPAQITYICDETQHEDIIYLGFSMGSTIYFVMASERPEFQEKIRAAIITAPVVYVKHNRSPLRHLSLFLKIYPALSRPITKGLFLKRTPAFERHLKNICFENTSPHHICKKYLYYILGRNSDRLTHVVMTNALSQIPDKTSAKTVAHYSQNYLSGKFRQYDYGIIKNKKKYNRYSPPEYKLNATTTPLYIFLGGNDYFANPRDLIPLFSQLPNIKAVDIVPFRNFTHMDFVTAKDAKTLVYDKIIERIKEILQEELSDYGDSDEDYEDKPKHEIRER